MTEDWICSICALFAISYGSLKPALQNGGPYLPILGYTISTHWHFVLSM